MLIYTRDSHMSVQLMYPKSASALSNEYVLNNPEHGDDTHRHTGRTQWQSRGRMEKVSDGQY